MGVSNDFLLRKSARQIFLPFLSILEIWDPVLSLNFSDFTILVDFWISEILENKFKGIKTVGGLYYSLHQTK